MTKSTDILHLRLYIAGNAPNSTRAQANLAAICRDIPAEQIELEVIDVLKEPLRALRDKVFVTPVLHKYLPQPERYIVGDLHDTQQVFDALGLDSQVGEKR